MPDVTVDLADLETLVITTGALKTIEGVMASRRNDPFVREHLDFTAAHDRLAAAMRNAKRGDAGTLVGWDDPLNKEEINALQYVAAAVTEKKTGLLLFVIAPEDKGEPGRKMSVYDQLAAKGYIEIGQFVQGVVWPAASKPDIVADPKGYAARLTARGRQKLADVK